MTTGQHSSLPSFARATLARLFGAEAQQALSGSAGTIEFQTNAAAVGPGLVITINANTFNVRNTGSRILVAAYMSGVAAAAVAGTIQIKRGNFAIPTVPPNPQAVSAAFATGSDAAHTWSGFAFAIDAPQNAVGSPMSYSAVATIAGTTLTSAPGTLGILVIEFGPGT